MKKPIIGIVSGSDLVSKGNYQKFVYSVNEDYINMIEKSGGAPVIIPYKNNIEDLEPLLNMIDGLLLIGGEDISTSCYSKKKKKGNPRDEIEIYLYHFFKDRNKPILGICRGLQLINVAEGGTLKNIENSSINHFIGTDGWAYHHNIIIEKDTKLYRILKEKQYAVSSVHHQQIDKLGKELIISGKSEDGIIESIENPSYPFIIGFQGHIEKCIDNFCKYKEVINQFIKESKNEKR